MSPTDFDRWLDAADRRPLVMGVLNVTPDSFSDGGRFDSIESAVAQARRMIADGADVLDVGGESTRPGAARVSIDEQAARVLPVIRAIAGDGIAISIDTTRSAVAAAALDAGACVINDVSAGRDDPAVAPLAAARGAAVVLMHMLGQPATMQAAPAYRDVVAEVRDFLLDRVNAFTTAGVRPSRLLIDPGIGFGKTLEHNLALLRHLDRFAALPHAVVIGTSRKGFIGQLLGRPDPAGRLFGTAASVAWAVARGAGIVRVHDVGPAKDVAAVTAAIAGDSREP